MIYGIIDVGSNTIRLSIYKYAVTETVKNVKGLLTFLIKQMKIR